MNWISVDDSLPLPGQLVVVYRDMADGLISGAIYDPHVGSRSPWLLVDNVSRSRGTYVTYWMILPEIPK